MTPIQITALTVHRIVVPLAHGYRMASAAVLGSRETVLVQVCAADGTEGWGEAPALPNWPLGMTPIQVEVVLRSEVAPQLEGRMVEDLPACLLALARAVPNSPFPISGVDMALHDLISRHRQVPAWNLLGEQVRHRTPVHYSLGIASVGETVQLARRAQHEGYTIFKCKVGRSDCDEEIRVLEALRKALGPSIRLRADANGAWNPEEAIRQIDALDRVAGLEFLEQPVPGPDLEGLDQVARAVNVPIMADESVATLSDIEAVARLGSVRLINLKVAQLGGLQMAVEGDRLCTRLGLQSMVGMVAEVGPARTARLHLAAVAVSATLGTATGVSAAEPVGASPEIFHEGMLELPTAPGLGVPVMPEALLRCRI